jgi:hypothetical protein
MKAKWYVVRLDGRGLKITSGPHKDPATANQNLKDPKDEVWSTVLCRKYGLIE